jgi:site-specific DNA recombinase
VPVLGYDVDAGGGKLLVNEEEALRVRSIFALYLERRSLMAVVEELNAREWRTKQWITREGREHAGRAFTKAALFRALLWLQVRAAGSGWLSRSGRWPSCGR